MRTKSINTQKNYFKNMKKLISAIKKLTITITSLTCMQNSYAMFSPLALIDHLIERHTKQAQLFAAIAQHDAVSVKKLIEAKAYVNFADVTMPLSLSLLIKCHHNALLLDEWTHFNSIERLSAQEACHRNRDTTYIIQTESPLGYAIRSGCFHTDTEQYGIITMLINAKADINGKDKHNKTPLIIAFSAPAHYINRNPPDTHLIKTLIKAKANVNETIFSTGMYGSPRSLSPLLLAYELDSPELIRILLDNKADINQSTWPFDSDTLLKNKDTPLTRAARNHNTCMIQALLELGANPTVKNTKNDSTLELVNINTTQLWPGHYFCTVHRNRDGRKNIYRARDYVGMSSEAVRDHIIKYEGIPNMARLAQMLIIAGADLHEKDKEGEVIVQKIVRLWPTTQKAIEDAIVLKQKLNELEEQEWLAENISLLLQEHVASKDIAKLVGEYACPPDLQKILLHPLVISYMKRKKQMSRSPSPE